MSCKSSLAEGEVSAPGSSRFGSVIGIVVCPLISAERFCRYVERKVAYGSVALLSKVLRSFCDRLNWSKLLVSPRVMLTGGRSG
jgi:hypothetical protein